MGGIKDKEAAKQKLAEAMASVPEPIINEMCQLVKQNSIDGCKASSCDIVYTPFLNLKKEERMDTGQVGFKDEAFRKLLRNVPKDKEVVKQLEKTRVERQTDLKEERVQRDEAERKRRRAFNEQQKQLEKEEAKRKAEEK